MTQAQSFCFVSGICPVSGNLKKSPKVLIKYSVVDVSGINTGNIISVSDSSSKQRFLETGPHSS